MQADGSPQGKLLHMAGEVAGHKNINIKILSVRTDTSEVTLCGMARLHRWLRGNYVKDGQTSRTIRRQHWELFVE